MPINHLIKIEEAGIGNPLLAEGLEAIERRRWEEPGRTDGDGPWSSGDLGRRSLLESFGQLLGGDEIRREAATKDRFELGAGESGWLTEGESGA